MFAHVCCSVYCCRVLQREVWYASTCLGMSRTCWNMLKKRCRREHASSMNSTLRWVEHEDWIKISCAALIAHSWYESRATNAISLALSLSIVKSMWAMKMSWAIPCVQDENQDEFQICCAINLGLYICINWANKGYNHIYVGLWR